MRVQTSTTFERLTKFVVGMRWAALLNRV